MVAVGSGTVNDIVKYASARRTMPYVAVPTAPSMNGYTSSVVAMMSKGLKVTTPATPPVAVVADMDVLCSAPPTMIQAGLGDIISKWTSNADWKLAHLVKGEYFCPLPFALIQDIEPRYLDSPDGLAAAEADTVAALTEALLYSGISMTIAGTSSPASGAEHLISHTLDMRAHFVGREPKLHGAQVGVATIFVAALYEKLCQWDPKKADMADLGGRCLPLEERAKDISTFFGHLGDSVIQEFEKKHQSWEQKRSQLQFISSQWQAILQGVRPYLMPCAQVRQVLAKAGAPTTAAALGVSPDEFLETVLHAHQIRSRYTVLDLAEDIGLLPDALEEVARASGVVE
jgi:glycerol-1-phosphate dehydrogenase [NAD(P)+]